jgi:SAM-dependent methyltransferase
MASRVREPNWRAWLARWDAQQESFNPYRERRFEVMFDLVEATLPKRFTALDLGAGPGSLSLRLLRRFPSARAIAVDFDPVTRHIGQGALGDVGGRLTWVDAKLGTPGWTDRLPEGRVDAALSTTALHWLTETELRALYRDLGRRLRRGGIFLNGDHLPWGPRSKGLSRLADRVRRQERGKFRGRKNPWRAWWRAAEKVPALAPDFEEQRRRAARHPHRRALSLELHTDALRRAGFRDIGVVWGGFEEWVLFARR